MESHVDYAYADYFAGAGNGSANGLFYEIPNYAEQKIFMIVHQYVYPCLLVMGIIGNCLSVWLMYPLATDCLSTCAYLVAAGVVDTVVLLTRCGNAWLSAVTGMDWSQKFMASSEVACKAYPFVFNYLLHYSRWLMVASAIEAAFIHYKPQWLCKTMQSKRARSTMLLFTVILMCINIHYFWSYELASINLNSGERFMTCTFTKYGHYISEKFLEDIYPIIDLLLTNLLPELIVALCVMIMCCMRKNQHHLGDEELQKWQKRFLLYPSILANLKNTLYALCIFYTVAMLPKFIVSLVEQLLERPGYIVYSPSYDRIKSLSLAVCSLAHNSLLSLKWTVYVCTLPSLRSKLRVCGGKRAKYEKTRAEDKLMMDDEENYVADGARV